MEHFQPIPQSMTGLLLGIVCTLGGVIVTLALYIRKLHNKHTEQVLKNTEEVTKVCSDVNNSLENNASATDRLTVAIADLHKYILESTRR